MFVATDDYPFFRDRGTITNIKKSRFKLDNLRSTVSKSQESLYDPLEDENSIMKKNSQTEKKPKKKRNMNSTDRNSQNLLDSVNEITKTNESNKNITEINDENLSTLIQYKKLEIANKPNPIFHLPPIFSKPSDPETTFLTFGELDEINERIFQTQQLGMTVNDKIKSKSGNKLNLELTYNKTQFQKLRHFYDEEELNKYKSLVQNINKSKLKELRNPKIKIYNTVNYSNNSNGSRFFSEVPLPETHKEKEVIEKKKENKSKKQAISYENLFFESSIYFYTYEHIGWRPEIRELCTMVLFEKRIYIYSGIGRNIMDDIVSADLSTLTWDIITQSGEVPSYGRYGHTSVLYNKKMYIFGGEKKYNSHLKQHECLNDVRYFSLENFKWKYIRPIGDLVDARRNHVATVVGRFMIINGGINPKDQFLNDFWSFDFMINKWVNIPVKGASKNGIAFHTCCSVFLAERTKIILNKPLESLNDDSSKKIQYEGLYYFGGKNGVYFSNELNILLIDQNPMALIKPDVGGKPPCARYGHSMIFNDIQNIVVIYGGRNDYENCFFGDVHILKLNILCWVTVKTQGVPKVPRASHCACNFNTKLVIFGGLNLNGLTNSDIVMVELDNTQVKKFVTLENNVKPIHINVNDESSKTKEKTLDGQEGKNPMMEDLKAKAQMLYFEEEEKQKMKKKKMEILMESLKYQNFKSFLPLPNSKFGNRGSVIIAHEENENSKNQLNAAFRNRNKKQSILKK